MRRLAVLSALLLALAPGAAWAKGNTELTLRLPAEGARIAVDGEQKIKRASREITITLKHGKHQLRIELEGYETVERSITLRSSATSMDIKMMESVPLLSGGEFAPPPDLAPPSDPTPVAGAPGVAPAPIAPPAAAPAAPQPAARAGKDLRIAVMELVPGNGVNAELAQGLTMAILDDTRKRPGITAVGQQDLFYRLTNDQRAKVRACKDDGCLTSLGFDLNVDEMIIPRVTSTGGSRLLTVERLEIGRQRVNGSTTRSAIEGREEQLLAEILPALDELYGIDKPAPVETPRALDAAIVARYEARPPLHRGIFIATASVAVVTGVVGGVFGTLSNSNQKSFALTAQQAQTQPVSASKLEGLRTQSTSQAQVANVAFIVAGALVVGAGVEALFTNWTDRPPPSPDAVRGGMSLGFTPNGFQVTWR